MIRIRRVIVNEAVALLIDLWCALELGRGCMNSHLLVFSPFFSIRRSKNCGTYEKVRYCV